MKSRKLSSIRSSKRLKVEGFGIHKLVSSCLKHKIPLSLMVYKSDMEVQFSIGNSDYQKLTELCGSKYRVTVLYETGFKAFIKMLIARKASILGIIIACFLVYYQSRFIAEIRVSGYRSLTEEQILSTLEECGLYPGAEKTRSPDTIKENFLEKQPEVSWVSVKYKGRLAEVKVVEALEEYKIKYNDAVDKPCNVVADKDGYIRSIIVDRGKGKVAEGTYVKKGDVLISGKMKVESTAYGTPQEKKKWFFVHAGGTVEATVPYYYSFQIENFKQEEQTTGRRMPGICITCCGKTFDSLKWANCYEVSRLREKQIFNMKKTVPLEVSVGTLSEIEIRRTQKTEKEIKKEANYIVRQYIKKNVPENAQILNNSLKFSQEENIIKVYAVIETLQKIGIEQEIDVGKQETGTKSEQ